MNSVSIKNGLISEIPVPGESSHEVQLPGGKKVTVHSAHAVAIFFGDGDEPNRIGPGGSGHGATREEAWENAVAQVRNQLPFSTPAT